MTGNKRPSTSSLRRFISSRPFLSVSDIRRRFGLDPDAVTRIVRNGTSAYVGLPEREALKLEELWARDEIGIELSVEVRAPVVIGVYPMRIARYVVDAPNGNGPMHQAANGHAANGHAPSPPGDAAHGQDPGGTEVAERRPG